MGSALQVLNAGATHILAQSQIDAARIKQKAHNAANITITDAKRLVQTTNNAASDAFAAAQRRVQTVNNDASAQYVQSQRLLQGTSNSVAAEVTAAQRRVQAKYNSDADQIAAANKVLQDSRNERAASSSSLSMFGQSIQNKSLMRQAGEQINALGEKVWHDLDQTTNASAFDRIAFSASLGANTAAAAGAGMGGGTFDSFNSNMERMQALKEEAIGREAKGRQYAVQQAKGQTMRQMGDGLQGYGVGADMDRSAILIEHDNSAIQTQQDNTAIFDSQDYTPIQAQHDYEVYAPDIDYTTYTDHKKMGAFQQVATFVGAGVATYFGGPQAGNAVFAASQAINDMQNGNMAAASQNMNTAFSGAMSGFKTYSAGADATHQSGQSWGQQIRGKSSAPPPPAPTSQFNFYHGLSSNAGANFRID
jgi:hypothetical protein